MSSDSTSSTLNGSEWTFSMQTASEIEVYDLRAHLDMCRRTNGRWLGLQCGADRFRTFVITRFVSTLTITFVMVGVGYLLG
jgi:hypothetical protein